MSTRTPVPTGTVALVAAEFLKQGLESGSITSCDLSDYDVPGTRRTYRQRTFNAVAKAAWELCEAVNETRPAD